jgi:hypothetical protein
MPKSKSFGKTFIKDLLELTALHEELQTFVDFGVGRGTYWNLLNPSFPNAVWIGIEAWKPYVEQFELENKYDQLIIEDMLTLNVEDLTQFDVGILGDVLEHCEKEDAVAFCDTLLLFSKILVLSLPLGYHPQDVVNGNPFEKHKKDDWIDEEVQLSFKNIVCSYTEGINGVYILSNSSKIRKKIRELCKTLGVSNRYKGKLKLTSNSPMNNVKYCYKLLTIRVLQIFMKATRKFKTFVGVEKAS